MGDLLVHFRYYLQAFETGGAKHGFDAALSPVFDLVLPKMTFLCNFQINVRRQWCQMLPVLVMAAKLTFSAWIS